MNVIYSTGFRIIVPVLLIFLGFLLSLVLWVDESKLTSCSGSLSSLQQSSSHRRKMPFIEQGLLVFTLANTCTFSLESLTISDPFEELSTELKNARTLTVFYELKSADENSKNPVKILADDKVIWGFWSAVKCWSVIVYPMGIAALIWLWSMFKLFTGKRNENYDHYPGNLNTGNLNNGGVTPFTNSTNHGRPDQFETNSGSGSGVFQAFSTPGIRIYILISILIFAGILIYSILVQNRNSPAETPENRPVTRSLQHKLSIEPPDESALRILQGHL